MADKKTPVSAREHADAIMEDLIAQGKIVPDADAATRSAGIPTFSKGTATLDPNTGKPVAPASQAAVPEFTEGQVAIPEGDGGVAPSPPTTKEAILAAHQERLAQAETTQPAAQEAGAAAAEATAEVLAEEYGEFEFEDPDLEVKIPVRVPKQYLEPAKRGYGRRAAYDRSVRYLKEAEPVLRQLVEDGRIHQVLPLLQAALDNQAYGEYVTQGFQRLQQGLPLMEQARQEAAAAAMQPPQPQVAQEFDLGLEDPFLAERIKPLMQKYETLEQQFARLQQEREDAERRQREQQMQNQRVAAEMQAAHQDIARAYPNNARIDLGPNDPFWQKASQLAREAGYVDAYGIRAGIVFGAQQAYAIEQERLAATASPTATALQAAEEQHLTLARQQAAAASRTVGVGSATPAPAPAPRQPPSTKNPDGTIKPAAQFIQEQQEYLASMKGRA